MNEKEDSNANANKRSSNKSRTNKASALNWVNPQFNSTDVTWLQDHEADLVNLIFEFLDDLTETEKVSIKHDDNSGRWLACLFCGDGDARNAGCALSVRGATPFDAFCALAYFHLVRYAREYPERQARLSGRWG